jgi:hypothetical protein
MAMKLNVFVVLFSVTSGGRSTIRHKSLLSVQSSKSEAECLKVMTEFVSPEGLVPDSIIEKSQDYCALRFTAENSYVCPKFKNFVQNSMADEGVDRTKPLKPAQVCYLTEYHLHELRVQTMNIPNMAAGNATLEEFGVHEDCKGAVAKAMSPDTALPKEKVPDFWYQFCLSQDCAHYLPSRHRWCKINKSPTPQHSNQLCLLVRTYAQSSLGSFENGKLGPDDVCAMYLGFVDESLHNAEAYEYVVRDGSKANIPEPNDPGKALLHSQMLNIAGSHHIRDNTAHPVKPEDKSNTRCHSYWMILFLSVVALFC